MFAPIYILILLLVFIFIWLKHYYLIHIKLNKYMALNFKSKWHEMKNDMGWYRPSWATLYFSKSVYDFIWKTDEDFNDQNINLIKKRIKKIVWELPLFFILFFVLTAFFVFLNWL